MRNFLKKSLPDDTRPVLTDAARRWLGTLPPHVRPLQLAQRFPNIVCLLAACWTDGHKAASLLDQLTGPRRAAVLPPAVEHELRLLREFNLRQFAAATDWDVRLVGPLDGSSIFGAMR